MMDDASVPAEVSSLVTQLRLALTRIAPVRGVYISGSAVRGDYRAGLSDIDLVIVTTDRLTASQVRFLGRMHQHLVRSHSRGRVLSCLYVWEQDLLDPSARHLSWSHRHVSRRLLSMVARAELWAFGIAVAGPSIRELLPPVSSCEVRSGVTEELWRYWSRTLRWPSRWWRDDDVDLALITMARAHATLADGSLPTKTEVLDRLDQLGVPPRLSAEIRLRRSGHQVPIGLLARSRRALIAYRVTAAATQRAPYRATGRAGFTRPAAPANDRCAWPGSRPPKLEVGLKVHPDR